MLSFARRQFRDARAGDAPELLALLMPFTCRFTVPARCSRCLARVSCPWSRPRGEVIHDNYSVQTANCKFHGAKVPIWRMIKMDKKRAFSEASDSAEAFLAHKQEEAKKAKVSVAADVVERTRRKRPKHALAAPMALAGSAGAAPAAPGAPPLPPPAAAPGNAAGNDNPDRAADVDEGGSQE